MAMQTFVSAPPERTFFLSDEWSTYTETSIAVINTTSSNRRGAIINDVPLTSNFSVQLATLSLRRTLSSSTADISVAFSKNPDIPDDPDGLTADTLPFLPSQPTLLNDVQYTATEYDVTESVIEACAAPGRLAGDNLALYFYKESGQPSIALLRSYVILTVEYDDTVNVTPKTILVPNTIGTPALAASGAAALAPETVQVALTIGTPSIRQAQITYPATISVPVAVGGPEVCIDSGWGTVQDPGVLAASEAYQEAMEAYPEVVYNDIYRSIDGGPWELIATQIAPNGAIVDTTNAVVGENCYKAIAWSALPSTAESEPDCVTIYDGTRPCPPGENTSMSAWLSAGEGFGVRARAYLELTINGSVGIENRVLHRFSGRTYPVEFSGGNRTDVAELTFTAPPASPVRGQDVATYEEWRDLSLMEGPHLYRDYQGRRFVGSITTLDVKDLGHGYKEISLRVTRTEELVAVPVIEEGTG